MSLSIIITIAILVTSACFAPSANCGVMILNKTRSGCLLSDNFNDGVMDTASGSSTSVLWKPLYADSSLDFREIDGYFQVHGNTGSVVMGQHRGIVTNYQVYNNWEAASLETLELVSAVDMKNLDPVTPGLTTGGSPAIVRMANHFCSNCYTSPADYNATVSVGYLTGTADGPGWDPPGGKWGFRCKWDVWSNRYLSANDSLFGDEADIFYPTMVDNWGFDAGDSTLATSYVYRNGNWIDLGSRKLYMGNCRKSELKSMAKWARNHDIDFRWDNFRLFPNSWRWPVRFTLMGDNSIPMSGNYVLEVRRANPVDFVVRDTLDGASEFSIFLDHTKLVIPETLKLVLYRNFTDSVAVAILPASEVRGCYPDDAYNIFFDSLANPVVGINSSGETDQASPAIHASYPNPFHMATTIRYSAPANSRVSLTVLDVRGREVATLLDGRLVSGLNTATWGGTNDAGRNVASGVYLIRLKTEDFEVVRKVTLRR